MTEKESMYGKILDYIADEINITNTMYDKAVKSYKAVGTWLSEGMHYSVRIMPQGSMNLGTVVKPIDDTDDYDMDLVCLIENGSRLPLNYIKNSVGDRLKENLMYRSKLEEEGKRCWTMQYDEFHMDILPCVPKNDVFTEPYMTAIKLTHKTDNGDYIPKYSDPYAYHLWFEKRMQVNIPIRKDAFSSHDGENIEKVPAYRMRTPLQKAIQLLKRHRDICFEGETENAPISIIITTLAAQAYNGEFNVYEALCGILERMSNFIEIRGNSYWIENPVMPEENFADKWNEKPIKQKNFDKWMEKAKYDLLQNPLACFGIHEITNKLKISLGDAPVDRALKRIGGDTLDARKNGNLYVDGLKSGLSTTRTETSKRVKEHTFFGK